jgi:hypothetical protein
VSGEDRLAVMREAGWKTPKEMPLSINLNETMKERGLGRLLRGEAYHRKLRMKYQKDARYPWLPVAPDPLEPK